MKDNNLCNNSLTVFQIAEKSFRNGLKIPAIQRNLVWNAARMEALWDSIMRGIPIGAISIRHGEIFDGQQRVHAICVGLNNKCAKTDSEIIWLDLCHDATKIRKFFFRVTTIAHPWGYVLTDDEKHNTLLDEVTQREAVEWLNDKGLEWELRGKIAERPYPSEFWPWTSHLPVPFGLLIDFVSQNRDNPSYANFKNYVNNNMGNWAINFNSLKDKVVVEINYWDSIIKAIKNLSNYQIPIINADGMEQSDELLYFKRLNKNGEEPSPYEIHYSMLKWNLPKLKKLDSMAKGFSSPSILAHLSMLYYKNYRMPHKIDEYTTKITDMDVRELSNSNQFGQFIESELEPLMKGADNLLGLGNPDGLWEWHRTRICQKCWPLYMYLMKASIAPENGINYAGLVLMVRLFSVDADNVVKKCGCLGQSMKP